MAAASQPRPVTSDEYLALARAAETKSEYIDGRIYATSGTSWRHNVIIGNVYMALRSQFRGRPCNAYSIDMRVRVSETGMYTYPDVVALCGSPRFEDAHVDTLLNPTVIVEVLSPSTERYDRGVKFEHYRRLDSLHEYVLVAQDRVAVEHYLRRGTQWLLTAYASLDEALALPTLDVEIPLADVYERVTPFDAEAADVR